MRFDADSPAAQIYSSYEISVNKDLDFKGCFYFYIDYTLLKSVDMVEYDSMVGGKLSLLAQKENNQDIALWSGDF